MPAEPVLVVGQRTLVEYTNHRGETAVRDITPRSRWYGISEWHGECWHWDVDDHERGARRSLKASEIRVVDDPPHCPTLQPCVDGCDPMVACARETEHPAGGA